MSETDAGAGKVTNFRSAGVSTVHQHGRNRRHRNAGVRTICMRGRGYRHKAPWTEQKSSQCIYMHTIHFQRTAYATHCADRMLFVSPTMCVCVCVSVHMRCEVCVCFLYRSVQEAFFSSRSPLPPSAWTPRSAEQPPTHTTLSTPMREREATPRHLSAKCRRRAPWPWVELLPWLCLPCLRCIAVCLVVGLHCVFLASVGLICTAICLH